MDERDAETGSHPGRGVPGQPGQDVRRRPGGAPRHRGRDVPKRSGLGVAPQPDRASRWPSRIAIGAAMVLAGAVWALQGLGILTAGDSFMIGDPTWVVIGAVFVVLGIWLAIRRS